MFEKQSARSLSQCKHPSLSYYPAGCGAGMAVVYHGERELRHPIAAPSSYPSAAASWRWKVTEKQLPKTSHRHPPLPTLPCAPEVVCDSQRTQLVCLMLMTKELTPDLSAPDESPAAHWKSGLPHTVQHSQQRVTFKGCYKTLSCAIIRGWPQHADRTDGYKKTGQLSIHHPQRRGSVWWNIIDLRSLCTLVFLIKIIIISDFWFDCLEKNLFKVILNWQKAPVVLLLTVVRSDPNNLTTNCTWDNNWR